MQWKVIKRKQTSLHFSQFLCTKGKVVALEEEEEEEESEVVCYGNNSSNTLWGYSFVCLPFVKYVEEDWRMKLSKLWDAVVPPTLPLPAFEWCNFQIKMQCDKCTFFSSSDGALENRQNKSLRI